MKNNREEKNNNEEKESQEAEAGLVNLKKQAKTAAYSALAVIFIIVLLFFAKKFIFTHNAKPILTSNNNNEAIAILEESGTMKESKDSYWWLNSGGIIQITKDGFATNEGELPKDSKWRKLYAKNNSKDTDNGTHPQNIFRLVTKKKWQNLSQSVYFKIDKMNFSDSENRNESNGVLLFNRYQDGDNLYYTGIRVDGDAVIKKKIDGKYYTIVEKNILTNGKKYNRTNNPNQLPVGSWFGIKSEVANIGQDGVDIKLYIDQKGDGNWQLALETQDKNGQYGKLPFTNEGYAGIRTDFMDVSFKDYKISNLDN